MLDLRTAAAYRARMRGEVERQGDDVDVGPALASHTGGSPHSAYQGDGGRRAAAALAGLRANVRRSRPSLYLPERLLKACLLIALYTVRSERQFCEQLNYNLLFRWFLDLGWDETPFDASTFAKNKQRLLAADVARRFFDGVVRTAKAARLLSAEHCTVDGTLI